MRFDFKLHSSPLLSRAACPFAGLFSPTFLPFVYTSRISPSLHLVSPEGRRREKLGEYVQALVVTLFSDIFFWVPVDIGVSEL